MSNLNDKLAALKGKWLERDDETDPNGRIYRDKVTGEIYHSVTRILSATAPEEQKKALEKWLERSDAAKLATWPQPAAPQPIHPPNMCSKLPNAWHAQPPLSATAGRWEKMAYIEHQKQSQNGLWKKPFKAAPAYPGALQVLLAGYAVGSSIT